LPTGLNHAGDFFDREFDLRSEPRDFVAKILIRDGDAFLRRQCLKDKSNLDAPFGLWAQFILEFLGVLCLRRGR